jgi:hypothetical protein
VNRSANLYEPACFAYQLRMAAQLAKKLVDSLYRGLWYSLTAKELLKHFTQALAEDQRP